MNNIGFGLQVLSESRINIFLFLPAERAVYFSQLSFSAWATMPIVTIKMKSGFYFRTYSRVILPVFKWAAIFLPPEKRMKSSINVFGTAQNSGLAPIWIKTPGFFPDGKLAFSLASRAFCCVTISLALAD